MVNFKPFLFVSVCVFVFFGKFYMKNYNKESKCDTNCKNITNEIEMITCLDSCAVNDTKEIPVFKIFALSSIILISFMIVTHYLELIYIKKDKTYITKLNQIVSFLINKKKAENSKVELDYIKLE